MDRKRYLDGWRGLAILGVVVGHFGPSPVSVFAGIGLELFFVLSGRLMAEVLAKGDLPTFFFRRASRILPALWFYVACIASFLLVGNLPLHWEEYFRVATFTINYPASKFEGSPLLWQIFSICIEEWSYIALAFITVVALKDSKRAGWIALLIAVLAMGNGLHLYLEDFGNLRAIYWRTDTRIASVLLSFAIARILRPRFFWVWLACGVAFSMMPLPYTLTLGTLCLAMAVNAVDEARFRKVFEAEWICSIGMISYSLYLWQHPFYIWPAGFPGLLAGVVMALVSYRYIEKPARDYLNKRHSTRHTRCSDNKIFKSPN